jgi:tetratricopeptide (TPR) repeat protein
MRTMRIATILAISIAIGYGCGAGNTEYRLRQSRTYLTEKQYEQASAELQQLVKLHPRDPELYYLLGQANAGLGNYRESIADYADAERNGIVQTADFFLKRGIAYYQTGDMAKAASSIEASVRIQPSTVASKYLGLIRYRYGDFEGAVQAFERSADLTNDTEALTAFGISLYRAGRSSDALELLALAHERDPKNDMLTYQTANASLVSGHAAEAVALYNAVPSTVSFYPDALYNKGEALLRLGEFPQAVPVFEKYLELHPDDKAAMFNLSSALIETKEYVIAADYLEKLLDDTTYRIRAAYNLGIANYNLQRLSEAARFLALAVRQAPENIGYRYAYGLALGEFGDRTAAREQMNAILSLDPGNADATAWLDRYGR